MQGVNSLALVIAHEMNRNYLADISRSAETSFLILRVMGVGTTLTLLLSEVRLLPRSCSVYPETNYERE